MISPFLGIEQEKKERNGWDSSCCCCCCCTKELCARQLLFFFLSSSCFKSIRAFQIFHTEMGNRTTWLLKKKMS